MNFDVSASFNEAIEAKTTAEQLKLKAERDPNVADGTIPFINVNKAQ